MKTDLGKNLSEEQRQELSILDQSQWHLLILLLAIILSYYSLQVQKQQLVCTATDPELCQYLPKVFPIRAVSQILTIAALIYFFQLSGDTLAQSTKNTVQHCQSSWNHVSSLLVLVAAFIRFGLLLQSPIS